MTTFLAGLVSGASIITLSGVSTDTLQMILGVAAGILLATAVLYVYLLGRQPQKPMRHQVKRSAVRSPKLPQQRYPASWPLAGAYAGVAL